MVQYIHTKHYHIFFHYQAYAAFLGVIKHIRMTQLMQNPDWREAYLQWQLKDNYTKGNIIKQIKPDIQGLMSLQADLK